MPHDHRSHLAGSETPADSYQGFACRYQVVREDFRWMYVVELFSRLWCKGFFLNTAARAEVSGPEPAVKDCRGFPLAFL
jgi:hypothetical protein